MPRTLDWLLSKILHYEIWGLIFSALASPATLLAIVAVSLMLLFRRRWCIQHHGTRYGTRPWLLCLVWGLFLLYNIALDMDLRTSLMCWLTLPALFPGLWGRLRSDSRWRNRVGAAFLWATYFGVWLVVDSEPAERIVTLLWACYIIPLATLGNARSWARDRLWLALGFSVVLQAVLSTLPRHYPTHGGVQIGFKDYAYTFCEIPSEHQLFAAVPCDAYRHGCSEGFVAEHDTGSPDQQVEHHFFSDTFRGRLVHLACLEDTVQVGMAKTQVDGESYRENVMEFTAADPGEFKKSLFGGAIGPRLAYDRRHDAIFYTSEWSRTILRLDRATGESSDVVSRQIYGPGAALFGSHLVENGSFHEGRDSVFFVQWLSGSKIFEIDRSKLQMRMEYDAFHGGSHGVAIDDELDRIWVTGLWGVDVIEVGTGEILSRSRLGFGCRLPVIDRLHDIVYVPDSIGRLWALDRSTLAVLGSILVGGGSRNPYVSVDGERLYASALHGYFYWSTAELAKRFR